MTSELAKIFWFTGLSGAGKSTLAEGAENALKNQGYRVRCIDGDDVRKRFTANLGFSREDILQNNRFAMDLCDEAAREADVLLVSLIAPFEASRREARQRWGSRYSEIFVSASLKKVMERDVKGLYQKAMKGEIQHFIGLSADTPYEIPAHPDLVVDTENSTAEESKRKVLNFIQSLVSLPDESKRHLVPSSLGGCPPQ